MASLTPYLRQTIRPLATSLSSSSSSSLSSRAAFSTSSIQRGLKESDKDRDNLNVEYDSHKQENLKNIKAGKAYWREELASESEAGVKADRGEASITENDIKGLKEEAVKGGGSAGRK
ncbi:hypothetical protein UA08_07184 [Talaromyces atroroseus]|uniref:Uncharacterized protein n=1 Tax=Talaromyces atroroseus TaxID=1441469 RepID=A0A225AB26_TALAT|nr:hypothetical protein UA08_07184 [Talaromyces atroroseus]OKL57440.1 hypothetical protein UA08_07184 [Talaromyces atroroseus]